MTEMTSAQRTRRPRHWRRTLIGPTAAFAAVTVVLLLAVISAMTRDATAESDGTADGATGHVVSTDGGAAVTSGPTTVPSGSVPSFPEPSTAAVVTTAVVSTAVLLLWWLGWSRRRTRTRSTPPTAAVVLVDRAGSTTGTSRPTTPLGAPSAEPIPASVPVPATNAAPGPDPVARKTAQKEASECLAPPAPGPTPEQQEAVLWRMRTTVADSPGSLAALCTALAGLRVDILTLQTHPLTEGTVDEFLLRAPFRLESQHLVREVTAAGGRDTWIERADAHDVVDTPTRVLALAARTAVDSAALPLSLRRLLGRCTIRSRPAVSASGHRARDLPPVEGVLDGTVMRLRDGDGGAITVERPYLAFTPTEFARARALVELDAVLGARIPRGQEVCTLAEGDEIVVGRAGLSDLDEATALHERCSDRALRQRYHGPVGDAHRYLNHLLDPRFGQTLAARTPSGRMVALGHLLWDGDETEVALLVEDDWQRRGIGAEMLRRLIALARETRCRSVYAVTGSSNTGMVSAMRGLGLPLDYQLEQGTLVITARLGVTTAALRPPAALRSSTALRSSAAVRDAAAGRRGPG